MSGREISGGRAKRLGPALLPLAFLLCVTVFQTTASADTLVITGGQIVMDSQLRFMSVNLTMEGLNISARVDDFPFSLSGPNFNFITASFNCGCDGFGRVTYDGLHYFAFSGGGAFNETTVSGNLTLSGNFDSGMNQPPFPLFFAYVGTGVLERTATRVTFTINSPVPEPGALLLLGTGFAGLAAGVRKRRKAARDARASLTHWPADDGA